MSDDIGDVLRRLDRPLRSDRSAERRRMMLDEFETELARVDKLDPVPTDLELETEEPGDGDGSALRRRGPRFWGSIAAGITLVVGLAVLARLSNDPVGPVSSIPAPPSSGPSTAADTATSDAAALAAIGERLVAAFDSRDPDTVAELVTDDADPVAMLGVTTKSGLIDLFGYIEAADLGFALQECVGREPDQVECTILQRSGFADAARVAPGDATMLLKIVDGRVVALRYGRAEGHGLAHDRFSSFIRETDPGATEKMWWSTSTGEPYPLLTEESFELFERYLQDFIDSES